MSGAQVRGSVAFEQRGGERTVRIHAVEAVVRRGDGGREHLPLGAFQRGAREVVDEELIGESAQVDAETRRQPDRREDARNVGQPADDRLFLGTHEALFVTCHGHPLLSFDGAIQPSMRYPPFSVGYHRPMTLPTEPIGSIPRPQALIDGMQAAAEGRVSPEQLDALYDDAVRDTLRRFEATGSPVVTDGEQRKPSFATYPVAGLTTLPVGA